jgi:hypothetical protein
MSHESSCDKSTCKLLLERRATVRFPCDIKATCRTGEDQTGVEWPATVRNVSPTGIAVVLGQPFSVGSLLTIRLLRPDGQTRCAVQANVMHVHNDPAGWVHGCLLREASPEKEWTDLLK